MALKDGKEPVDVIALDELPAELGVFIEEMAQGTGALYGEEAAEEYRQQAPALFQANLENQSAGLLASVTPDGACTGLLLMLLDDGLGRVGLVHVRTPFRGADHEQALGRAAVAVLRGAGAERILFHFLPLCELNLEPALTGLGFWTAPHLLMGVDLEEAPWAAGEPETSRPLTQDDIPRAAAIIAAAYRDHPARNIDREVQDPDNAARFLALAQNGGYGRVEPGWLRVLEREGELTGVAVAAQAAPGVGFLIQLAVAPECQGSGAGKTLLRDMGRAFRVDGYSRMALGVLASNPARKLYDNHGFHVLRHVDTHVWQRPNS